VTVSIVSSAAALTAALGQARPGDTIALAPGNYGTINIQNVNFSSPVYIVTEGKLAPATLSGLNVSNSSNLIFSGLNIQGSGANVWYYANVTQSHDIRFVSDSFKGSDSNLNNDAGGLNVQGSQNVTVLGCTFSNLTTGISEGGNNYVRIRSNNFTGIQSDGIDNAGSSWVNIVDNYFSNFFPTATEHPDGIQFWTEGTSVSAHNIYISGNSVVRGSGATVQGIFVQDDSGVLPYGALTISNNQIVGEGYNGIAVQGSVGATVSDNVVQPYNDVQSWIEVQNSKNGKLTNNSAGSYVLTTNVNLGNSGNTILGAIDIPVGTLGAATTTTAEPGPSAVEDSGLAIGPTATAAQRLVGAMGGFGATSASVSAVAQEPSPLMSFLTRPYA
jgi:hypothetical protein